MCKNSLCRSLPLVAILACMGTSLPVARAVTIQTVPVGDAGNLPDTVVMTTDGTTGYGSVAYEYRIATHDVTNAQYVDFLNAKASTSDPYGLYLQLMSSDTRGGILRSGSGPYTYSVKSGFANKPVVFVSWYDSIRFSNWLTNGQGSTADTESGAYAIAGGGVDSGTVVAPNAAQRAAWSTGGTTYWMLPSEDEWYKAAYYKGGGTNAGYWLYPFENNTAPTGDPPPGGSNSANFFGSNGYAVTQSFSFSSSQVYLTDVGAYSSAMSPYDLFDMGGNVFQWNDALISAGTRGHRGGSWTSFGTQFLASSGRNFDAATAHTSAIGFRLVSVPEPSSLVLLALGGIGSLLWTRHRRNRCWIETKST